MIWTNAVILLIGPLRTNVTEIWYHEFDTKKLIWKCCLHNPSYFVSAWILKLTRSLQWRHNERDGISNHQPNDCLLNRLFRHRSKKTSKLCVAGLCEGNSPMTGEFSAQRASNAEMFPFDDVIMWNRLMLLLYAIQMIIIAGAGALKSVMIRVVKSDSLSKIHTVNSHWYWWHKNIQSTEPGCIFNLSAMCF